MRHTRKGSMSGYPLTFLRRWIVLWLASSEYTAACHRGHDGLENFAMLRYVPFIFLDGLDVPALYPELHGSCESGYLLMYAQSSPILAINVTVEENIQAVVFVFYMLHAIQQIQLLQLFKCEKYVKYNQWNAM